MKKNKIYSIVFVVIAILYTILVKTVDVSAIGPENSVVGFSHVNELFKNSIGSNMTIYKITEYLGYAVLLIAASYCFVAFIQLLKRKSLKKIDKELYVLFGFYALVVITYVFFEKVIINYRPIILEGVLEASYPSSHTMLAICICASSIIINKILYRKSKCANAISLLCVVLLPLVVVGRLVSGVHWFTDIIGGVLISIAMISIFKYALSKVKLLKKGDKSE